MQARTDLCLVCRTALAPGEACDGGEEHRIVSLTGPAGREAALAATWGDGAARTALERARVKPSTTLADSVIGGIMGGGLTLLMPQASAPLALIGVVVGGTLAWANSQPRQRPLVPVGGAPIASSPRHTGRRGEVVGTCTLRSPASGTDCVAWAIELRADTRGGPRVLLRDAESAGFELHLTGGGLAHVPSGRWRLLGAIEQQVDVDDGVLAEYLTSLMPDRRPDTTADPFHASVVCEQIILPGDVVELAGVFEPTPSPRAEAALYRDQPATRLTPRGVPVLRVPGNRR